MACGSTGTSPITTLPSSFGGLYTPPPLRCITTLTSTPLISSHSRRHDSSTLATASSALLVTPCMRRAVADCIRLVDHDAFEVREALGDQLRAAEIEPAQCLWRERGLDGEMEFMCWNCDAAAGRSGGGLERGGWCSSLKMFSSFRLRYAKSSNSLVRMAGCWTKARRSLWLARRTLRIQSVGGVLMRSVAEAQKTVSSPRGLDDAFCGVRGLRLVRHFNVPLMLCELYNHNRCVTKGARAPFIGFECSCFVRSSPAFRRQVSRLPGLHSPILVNLLCRRCETQFFVLAAREFHLSFQLPASTANDEQLPLHTNSHLLQLLTTINRQPTTTSADGQPSTATSHGSSTEPSPT
ncbi:hypothetical protein KC346_g38 [Hortaea werneckii]|nr:hypothetical protein KC346_g38 [Hortaea werneckii]